MKFESTKTHSEKYKFTFSWAAGFEHKFQCGYTHGIPTGVFEASNSHYKYEVRILPMTKVRHDVIPLGYPPWL